MKLSTILSLVILSFLLQGGCQGGSDPIPEGTALKPGSIEPLTALTCSDRKIINDINYSEQSGYDGNVTYNCHIDDDNYGFSLAEGLDSMILEGLDNTSYINITCPTYSLELTVTKLFNSGRVNYVGKHSEYGDISCNELYVNSKTAFYSEVVTDKESIDTLFTWNHAQSNQDSSIYDHSSNCPDILYEKILDDMKFDVNVCHGKSVENYKIRDEALDYYNLSVFKTF